MAVRWMLRFTKTGALRWISHLDTMRTLEKALRRAALPVVLTKGFNPHPIMSLAVPLAVGVASVGEYLELEMTGDWQPQAVQDRLDAVLPADLRVLSAQVLPERAPALMSLVQLSQYRFYLPSEDAARWASVCAELLSRQELLVKRTKKSGEVSDLDIRPGLVSLHVKAGEGRCSLEATFETSSQLFIRLQEILDALTTVADEPSWALAETDPLRLDLGVREANAFRSLEQYFPQ